MGMRTRRVGWLEGQVFRRVRVEGEAVESVAGSLQLPPERVARWVELGTEQAVADAFERGRRGAKPEEAELQFSRELAAERLGYLVELAIDGFLASQGVKTETRRTSGALGQARSVTKFSAGDVRFLKVAGQLMLMQKGLPVSQIGRSFAGGDLPESDAAKSFTAAALDLTEDQALALKEHYEAKLIALDEARRQGRERAMAAAVAAAEPSNSGRLNAEELARRMADEETAEEAAREAAEEDIQEENHPDGECSACEDFDDDPDDEEDSGPPVTPEEAEAFRAEMQAFFAAKQAAQGPVQPTPPGGAAATPTDKQKRARRAFLQGG